MITKTTNAALIPAIHSRSMQGRKPSVGDLQLRRVLGNLVRRCTHIETVLDLIEVCPELCVHVPTVEVR